VEAVSQIYPFVTCPLVDQPVDQPVDEKSLHFPQIIGFQVESQDLGILPFVSKDNVCFLDSPESGECL